LSDSQQIRQEGPTGRVGGTLHGRRGHAERDAARTQALVPGTRPSWLGTQPNWLGPGNHQLIS
jgi:hypothetical protein